MPCRLHARAISTYCWPISAGRLHVKANLMEELRKIVRVMQKLDPAAPHEVLLVLDAGPGRTAFPRRGHSARRSR
jgi:signal recognition particle GTPase